MTQAWWYLTRASGIVAWLTLTASVVWGIALSATTFPGRRRPAWMLDLHRWLGALTLAFIGLHVSARLAGSDRSNPLYQVTGAIAVVTGATAHRLRHRRPVDPPTRSAPRGDVSAAAGSG